jgi:phosphate uptake regulator
MSVYQAFPYFLIAKILERIGDHATKIASAIELLHDRKISTTILQKISELGKRALEILERALTAFYKRSIEECNLVIDWTEELSKRKEELMEKILVTESKVAVPLAYILESIERTSSYGSDIAEVAINYVLASS